MKLELIVVLDADIESDPRISVMLIVDMVCFLRLLSWNIYHAFI
jgi:hypothetical protein